MQYLLLPEFDPERPIFSDVIGSSETSLLQALLSRSTKLEQVWNPEPKAWLFNPLNFEAVPVVT